MSSQIPETFFTSADEQPKSRKQFLLEMKNSAEFCLQLCNETDMVNPLIVTFSYNNCLLESIFIGDTSVRHWRHHRDLVCAATALGLHRESHGTSSKISLALEVRRRAHAGVFGLDKAISSFTGRSVVLSRRFCTAILPLDVADEYLMLPHEELMEVVNRDLDANGWNTTRKFFPATRIRVFYYMALIRDEILESSLGTTGEQLDVAQVLDLKRRALEQYHDFPKVVKYKNGDTEGGISDGLLYGRVAVRCKYLQNMYLIE